MTVDAHCALRQEGSVACAVEDSRMNETKRVNLALQGGGSHGAFTWGVLDALLEDERLVSRR